MRSLRPGWVRRWPTGYLGPAGQVIVPAKDRNWQVTVTYRGVSVTKYATTLEQAQVKAELMYRSLVDGYEYPREMWT